MSDPGSGHVPFPERPLLTPVFICSLAFWAACAISYSNGRLQSPDEGLCCVVAGGVACVLAMPFACLKRTRMLGVVVAAVSIGFCLGASSAVELHLEAEGLRGYSGPVSARLIEDSSNSGYGERALVRVQIHDSPAFVMRARFGDVEPMLAGERLACNASFSAADYTSDSFSWNDGSCGNLAISSFELQRGGGLLDALVAFRAQVIDAIGDGSDSRKLLKALVCGYRRDIRETELYGCFQTCGLAHMVAVSGAHLVIVTGLFATALRRMRIRKQLTIVVLIAVMFSYFIVAGMPVSALRALIMSATGLLAFFGRRRASSLNAVGVGVFTIVVMDPSSCLSASFVLSGLSTAGIVVFAPLFMAWFERTPIGRARVVSEALSLTLSASLLSQPYACSLFSQLPLVAPLSNIAVTPLFPLVCTAGLIFAVVIVALPALTPLVGIFAEFPSALLAMTATVLADIPHASIPVSVNTVVAFILSFASAFLLWVFWPKRARNAAISLASGGLAIVALSLLPLGAADRIVMLDIGQGDAILVQSRGESMLVDTGNQDSRLLEQLGRNHMAHIDTLLVTHADDDHCGSLDALRKAVTIDRAVLAKGMVESTGESARDLVRDASSTVHDIVEVEVGDTFTVGAFTAKVIWPNAFSEEGGNADSLCVLLEYDGDGDERIDFTALMTGDAEKEEIASMIDSGALAHVDVLKVGHHGSRNGTTLDEMRTLSPKLALISCGKNNRYGHPAPETLDQLESVGATAYRTDQNGAITCTFTPEAITVDCTTKQ